MGKFLHWLHLGLFFLRKVFFSYVSAVSKLHTHIRPKEKHEKILSVRL